MASVSSPSHGALALTQATDGIDVNKVRYQVCRLMRMLVQVCQTLDQLPSEVRTGTILRCTGGGGGEFKI